MTIKEFQRALVGTSFWCLTIIYIVVYEFQNDIFSSIMVFGAGALIGAFGIRLVMLTRRGHSRIRSNLEVPSSALGIFAVPIFISMICLAGVFAGSTRVTQFALVVLFGFIGTELAALLIEQIT